CGAPPSLAEPLWIFPMDVSHMALSSAYSPLSQQLILRFVKERRISKLARFVRPQDPFDFNSPFDAEVSLALSQLENFSDLNRLIGMIDGKPIPSLLLSYEKLGAEYLAFNVDREFNRDISPASKLSDWLANFRNQPHKQGTNSEHLIPVLYQCQTRSGGDSCNGIQALA
ncbi:MAG: hypothetical protein WCH11_08060, partial [Bdellovibrio sp.]